MARRKTTSSTGDTSVLEHEHSTSETEHGNGTSEAGNGAKKTRRTTRTSRKTAAERIPEEVTVDFQAVKDQLKEASVAVRDAVTQAESVRFEAAQVQTRLQERARETETEAADALAKIRKARQEVEAGLEEVRRHFEEARAHRVEVEQRREEKAVEVPQPAEVPAPVTETPAARAVVAEPAAEPVVAEAGEPVEKVARLEGVAGEGEEVIKATIRSEPPRHRLIRHLSQAHSAESAVLEQLEEASKQILEPSLRATLGEHRVLTHRHKLALEGRLRALGAEPATNGKGVLQKMVGWIWESWQREPDDYDHTVQELLKATAAEHFEVTMYRALGALAEAVGDEETVALARQNHKEKAEAVAALDRYAPSLAGLAEQMVGVASAADPEHVVIEAEVKPEPAPAAGKK